MNKTPIFIYLSARLFCASFIVLRPVSGNELFTGIEADVKMVLTTRTAELLPCGVGNPPPSSPSPKISGGIETGPNEFPWQVYITTIDGSMACGGVLISDQWILTAASCIIAGKDNLNVSLGVHQIENESEKTRQNFVCTDLFSYPGYNPYNKLNDIGLVKLPLPVNITRTILPICLPRSDDPDDHDGDGVVLTGWMNTSVTSTRNPLRKMNATVISNQYCAAYHGNSVTSGTICASSGIIDNGICQEDFGGPMNYQQEVNGSWTLIGIASFRSGPSSVPNVTCQSNAPFGYTRLTSFLHWIYFVTGLTEPEIPSSTVFPSTLEMTDESTTDEMETSLIPITTEMTSESSTAVDRTTDAWQTTLTTSMKPNGASSPRYIAPISLVLISFYMV